MGDLDFIGANLKWLEGMMVNYSLPPDGLSNFLLSYHEAAQEYLAGPAGEIVLQWLGEVVKTCEMGAAELAHYQPPSL